jgi:RNA polymerase sigma-54 factor
MLKQYLSQKLQQKLSPQQIQLMKLLQVPTAALEERIKEELEENPALEEGTENEEYDSGENDEFGGEEESTQNDDFDVEDYLKDEDDYPYYKSQLAQGGDERQREMPLGSGQTFHELLIDQIGLHNFSEEEAFLARFIIGNLNEDGYLMRSMDSMVDDLAFTQGIETTVDVLEQVLLQVQDFEPPGIAARSLQECLIIQLKKKDKPSAFTKKAALILEEHYESFTKKHYDKIKKRLGLSEDDMRASIREIIHCNPKPGGEHSGTQRVLLTIIPDFLLHIEDGNLHLSLNSRNAPELKVSRTYADMLRGYAEQKSGQSKENKDAVTFIRQKVEAARWFIDAIKQRQETLLSVMNTILQFQYDYFLTGDETRLKPMVLRDIAEKVGLDISTVSRVANSKYIETPYGTFLLKSFFSEGIQTESGEDASSREVKKILADCIAAENKRKPLTDDRLTTILSEKGYQVARRTVAKYREQLEIPVARLRKTLE